MYLKAFNFYIFKTFIDAVQSKMLILIFYQNVLQTGKKYNKFTKSMFQGMETPFEVILCLKCIYVNK